MNAITLRSAVALGCCLLAVLTSLGCSHTTSGGSTTNVSHRTVYLSASKAADMAADLANAECERRFHRRPFRPEQYTAILQDGEYRWGGLDVGARAGYSALVIFALDGSHPKVEVYFSMDMLTQ